jgi:hypothetical protein
MNYEISAVTCMIRLLLSSLREWPYITPFYIFIFYLFSYASVRRILGRYPTAIIELTSETSQQTPC